MMALYGPIQMNRWNDKVINKSDDSVITVRIGQGCFALRSRWDVENVMEILERSIKLTGRFDEKKKYLVVWPETIINASGALQNAIITQIIHMLGEKNFLVFGGVRYSEKGSAYNSAYFVSGKAIIKVYDKTILLPFAETTPWGIRLFRNFYEAPERFDEGTLPAIISMNGLTVGSFVLKKFIHGLFVNQ